MLAAVAVEQYAKSPLTPEEAKNAAIGIATTITGTSIALWLAHAAAEAASLGQYEAIKNLDDMVIAKLGLGTLGARILSVPIETGIISGTEYFYKDMFRPTLQDPDVLKTLLLRGDISDEYHDEQFKLRGFSDEKIAERKKSYMEIPGFADLTNMVVKEVLTIDDYRKWGLKKGFSEDWSQKIWDAHFMPPSREELWSAWRRGKISDVAVKRLERIVDLDDRFRNIDGASGEIPLSSAEVVEGKGFDIWSEMRYIDVPLTIVRFMYELRAVTDADLPKLVKAIGYKPEITDNLVSFIQRFQARRFLFRAITVAIRKFYMGIGSEKDLRDACDEALLNKFATDAVVSIAKAYKDIQEAKPKKKVSKRLGTGTVIALYVNRVAGWTRERAYDELIDSGWSEDNAKDILNLADAKPKVPLTAWFKAVKKGIKSRDELIAELESRKFEEDEAELWVDVALGEEGEAAA